ncbi:MAG: hypothetical protein MJE68_06035 [Proteobacteria bacterium]|nr:hypothetical protein [Pseudomonadota bacterium]
MSHHVHVLVTYSNIHKRQCARGIREKRERKRGGEIREREGEIEIRERGGGRELACKYLPCMHACMHSKNKWVMLTYNVGYLSCTHYSGLHLGLSSRGGAWVWPIIYTS